MIGRHCIRSWSKTQATIALSSAEAELIALVKSTTEGIGMTSLMRDVGRSGKVQVYADASAALGIVARKRSRQSETPGYQHAMDPAEGAQEQC